MKDKISNNLIIYFVISMVTFFYFILCGDIPRLGISLFFIVMAIGFYLLSPKHKGKLLIIPISIISLYYVISDSYIWFLSSGFIIISLFIAMMLLISNKLEITNGLSKFIRNIFKNLFYPFRHMGAIYDKLTIFKKNKSDKVKKVFKGICISIPFIIIIFILLSSADMIFSMKLDSFMNKINNIVNIDLVFKLIFSILVGSYFFGLIYGIYKPKETNDDKYKVIFGEEKEVKEKDPFVSNIVLIIILSVYTLFIIIQIRYLFASNTVLPYDLSYSEYARRGFFELVFLTGINICIIIYNSYYLKDNKSKARSYNQGLLYYLCSVNVTLLISSFYRMLLYTNDYGLTRLRLFVFGFLIFEMIGLIITYFYIRKPRFNIVLVYILIGLFYYMILVIVPTDRLIAKNLIDRYYKGKRFEIEYVTSLSLDAADEVKRLFNDTLYKENAKKYFEYSFYFYDKWQSLNMSVVNAKEIYEKEFGKYVQEFEEYSE